MQRQAGKGPLFKCLIRKRSRPPAKPIAGGASLEARLGEARSLGRADPNEKSGSERREELPILGRPGSDLLSQGLSHSTIGAEEFNGRVRDGIGYWLPATTTRPAKDGSGVSNQ